MKRFSKIFGIIAIIAMIGFGVSACDFLFGSNGNDDDSNNNEGGSSGTPSANAQYGWYGNGSASSFTISNYTQLEGFAKIVAGATGTKGPAKSDFAGKTVILTADIDMSGKSWLSIGSKDNNWGNSPFNGTFDGGNKTISSLQVDKNGFFYSIGEGGIVKNLIFVGANVGGSSASGGCMASSNSGLIQNISINGSVKGSKPGGIVEDNYGIVENCRYLGNVSGGYGSGGIVAYNRIGGVVRNCSFAGGSVTSWGSEGTGGIVGQNMSTVESCYVTGNVTGGTGVTGGSVGGIVGENWPTAMVKNCYVTGDVSGEVNTGGVVGNSTYDRSYSNSGTIQNCYATGNVTGYGSSVGGISGGLGRIENCVALNSSITAIASGYGLTATSRAGRVVGSSDSTRSNNYGLNGMTMSTSAEVTVTSAANGIHGEDVDAEDYNTQTWWATNANWDFNTIWRWDDSIGLPVLR